jgi:hypothetical protein
MIKVARKNPTFSFYTQMAKDLKQGCENQPRFKIRLSAGSILSHCYQPVEGLPLKNGIQFVRKR